jgi:hypothetical protein
MPGIDLSPKIEAIMTADSPEIEKLSKAYVFILSQHIEIAEREIELLKALGDQEGIIKEQIKANTIAYTLDMFRQLHIRATGRKVSDE